MDDDFVARAPSLGHLLRQQAERLGHRELFRFEGVSSSFADVEARSNAVAAVLQAHGVARGDRVVICLPNSIDWPVCWLGVLKAGAVTVPVNVQYQESDLTYVLRDSGASLALAGAEQAELLARVRPGCPDLREVAVLDDEAPLDGVSALGAELAAAPSEVPIDADLGTLANLQYTSGTTGFPKACMLSHEYWLRIGDLVIRYGQLGPDDVVMSITPFSYVDPQWITVAGITAGCPVVILPRFSPSTFWRDVSESGVTYFYVLGTMPVYLMKQPVTPYEREHRVRMVSCSGIVPQLHAEFERRWGMPWREAYGLTETAVDLLVPLDDDTCVGTGAMGTPIFSKDVRLMDDTGQFVNQGDVGEIVVQGKPMMLGYWNKPEATAAVMRDDGWLHTGDLAYQDEKGYFHIVGRTKDMIRRSGENIAAAEVEAVLVEHPGVRNAAAVPVPDELRGEEVKVFVQLQPGETPVSVPPAELHEFARSKLARFKVPRFWEYVDDFPMTASERIAKHVMLAAREDQRAGSWDAATGAWG